MPKFYKVVSTSRSRHTRGVRRLNPTHDGLVQYIGGVHRLVRGRPLVMTAAQIKQILPELRAKRATGMVMVTTMDDRAVDLDTYELVPDPPPAPTPVPSVLPDSISRDDPPPTRMLEPLPGTTPLGMAEDFKMPVSIGVEEPVDPPEDTTESIEPPDPTAPTTMKSKKRRR